MPSVKGMFKFLIILILLCLPPYGWIALLIWAAIAMGGSKKEEGRRSSGPAPSAPPPAPAEHKPEYEPVNIKVNNGRCDVYSAATGAYLRSVGSDAVQASVGGNYIAVVSKNGCSDIYQAATGCYIRRMSNDAVSAQIQGDDVAITNKSGRTDIYDVATGCYKRML